MPRAPAYHPKGRVSQRARTGVRSIEHAQSNQAGPLSPAAHDAEGIGHIASAATQRADGPAVVAIHPQLDQLARLGPARWQWVLWWRVAELWWSCG